MPLLFALALFFLVDILVLIAIGNQIGLLATLLWVVGTAFVGFQLIRRGGAAAFRRIQERLAHGEVPSGELLTATALIVGGALLMTPGLLSDILGGLCLLPHARRLLGQSLAGLGGRFQTAHDADASPHAADADWQRAGRESSSIPPDDAGRHGAQTPLEGEFISRDEPRR